MVAVVGTALGPVLVAVINEASGSFEAVAPLLVWIPLTIAAAVLVARPPHRLAAGEV
ncbi:MAG TPA: hypothetical protein VMP67_10395 [Candidatus Limnocylindria bacterium]|nr:hypothetical protein [Candidatus Limnocylindria bacterium]